LGITQEQSAARLRVSRGTYRQLERRVNPQLSTLLALAEAGFDLRRIVPELFQV
jgi:transcriptional regulator with XRE-family HTH domain